MSELSDLDIERREPNGVLGADVVDEESVLEVKDLAVDFFGPHGTVRVVEDLSFDIKPGETFGIVGESGSGKTVSSLAIMGLISSNVAQISSGSVRLNGRELLGLSARQLRKVRGREIGMIFQEPKRSLDPSFTVGHQIAETVRVHLGLSRREAWQHAVKMLDLVRIPDAARRAKQYPFEFSGGMAQRVMLAIALSCSPKVLIADEPTTALDVSVQNNVLSLIQELQDELGIGVLFISHDLGVVAEMCDRVAVMYAGQIVERGTVEDIFFGPRHPYTAALLSAIPGGHLSGGRLTAIPGIVPPAHAWPTGCRFNTRCPHAVDTCRTEAPPLVSGTGENVARCHLTSTLSLKGVSE
ncbi:ABC transporter ATP-binding protein [Rhodococcus rhodochrous]|uniref:ABC transporter ATP-binding protein n=1 Tax=Rhodococcus rhodochrous TaxID=1829 RepID=UPI000371FECF|nr:ABC transporter ATP-binding protein [Rhodococcus rhodochrous]